MIIVNMYIAFSDNGSLQPLPSIAIISTMIRYLLLVKNDFCILDVFVEDLETK